MAGRRA